MFIGVLELIGVGWHLGFLKDDGRLFLHGVGELRLVEAH